MPQTKWVFFLALAGLVASNGIVPRPRRCCQYNTDSKICDNLEGCVLKHQNETLHSPGLDVCHITEDSKKNPSPLMKKTDCLARNYDTLGSQGDWTTHFRGLPFTLNSYIFEGGGLGLPGVEVSLDYGSDWSVSRFRIINRESCPENNVKESEECHPRCVEVLKSHGAKISETKLLYDCEVGFYTTKERNVAITSGQTYEFNICMDRHGESVTDLKVVCDSFFFLMPDVDDIAKGFAKVPILEKSALQMDNMIILHFPKKFLGESFNYEEGKIVLFLEEIDDNENWQRVFEKNYTNAAKFSTTILTEDSLMAGKYKISFEAEGLLVDLAKFEVADYTSKALGITLFFIFLVAAIVLVLYVYKRYKQVENSSVVNPIRLLESGRIKGKSVFIITNVDNRHHIDIVISFSKYLKTFCAVHDVYFALDEKSGIKAQEEHDPWKWAMEVAEKMGTTNLVDACLVFIAAPPQKMGVPIYTDLPNNQAFVSAKYLKNMVDENRVAILQFPYSDPETVPTLIPSHVRERPYSLPKEMNDFLCQLLDVKKRAIFNFLPFPLVKPQVLPHDLSRTKEGEKLFEQISNLSHIVDRFRAEQKKGSGNTASSTISRTDETISTFSDSEDRKLLSPKRSIVKKNNSSRTEAIKNNDDGDKNVDLKIEIEPNIMSLRGAEANVRDRRIDPEFREA